MTLSQLVLSGALFSNYNFKSYHLLNACFVLGTLPLAEQKLHIIATTISLFRRPSNYTEMTSNITIDDKGRFNPRF